MTRPIVVFDTPSDPSSVAAQDELSFISGLDAAGNVASDYYWTGSWLTYPNTPAPYNWAHKWSPTQGEATAGSSGGVVNYSFGPGWSTAEENAVISGLALWSAVANIQFQLVPYSADPAHQSPLIFYYSANGSTPTGTAYSATAPGSTLGTPGLGQTLGTIVQFDPYQLNMLSFGSFTAYGGYGIDTIVHELGHVLGLGHAGGYNGSADPATQQFGVFDTRLWSIMSYIDPSNSTARYFASYPVSGTNWGLSADNYYREPTTWMPLDVLAVQRLYGVAISTPLSGGQTFGFNCNIAGPIEPFFDFTINSSPVLTLWDAGSGNTLDVSGFSAPAVIDLRPGAFSSVDGMVNNIAIAFGTQIDTAVGGPGDTIFVVNAGSDRILGGSGANQAVFATGGGNFQDLTEGSARVISGAGVSDTLFSVGTLVFTGGSDTIFSNVGGVFAFSGGDNALFLGDAAARVTLGGADTLVATTGFADVTAAGSAESAGDFVYGSSGGLVFHGGATADTVVGAAVTVAGGSGGMIAYGLGTLVGDGGSGYNVLASFGGDSETVRSGAGGGLLVGGTAGNNRLVANGGAATIFTGGSGDVVTLANAAADIVVMGGGAETVNASAAAGQEIVYTGSGNDLVQGGNGTDFIAAGTGNATLTGGSGINAFMFINGQAGGVDIVTNWNAANDYLFLINYGGGADQAALASQVQAGGNTLVTLADHTQIWFMNTQGVGSSSFV